MRSVKAILFDVDGVIVNSEKATDELEKRYGISTEVSQVFFDKEWPEIIIGHKDIREVLPPYLKNWGWEGTVEDYLKFWFEFEHKINEALVSEVQKIRKRGIRCFIATNQEKVRTKYMIKEMGFANSFDGIYSSSHLGYKKPDVNYFREVVKDLSIKPEEILFWDDSRENVEAALSMGLKAELFASYEHLQIVMKDKYGL